MSAAAATDAERGVTVPTSDGWEIAARLHVPEAEKKVPGVVLVHGSRHESDAYGSIATPGLLRVLSERSLASLRIDIRGRGGSREPLEFHSMTPEQRKGVRLDIAAAIDFLASQAGVDGERIGLVAEQDSADPAIIVGAKRKRVAAISLISGRLGDSARDALDGLRTPVFCLVSKEDRVSFRDMIDCYLASKGRGKRLVVLDGIGIGTTMFSVWEYEFPQEEPIPNSIGIWLADQLEAKTKQRRRSTG